MKNEQTTDRTVLFLYEIACIAIKNGEEARYYFQFYDESWQEAIKHAEYHVNLYGLKKISGWEIKNLQTIYFS